MFEWRERMEDAVMVRYFAALKARKGYKLNRRVPGFVVRRRWRARMAKGIVVDLTLHRLSPFWAKRVRSRG